MRILVFDIDGRRFGLDASGVREVLPAATLTLLPNLPPGVQGVLDVRGTAVPIIGVRRTLGLEERPLHSTDHLVIAHTRGRTVGLHVDHAIEIVSIDPAALDAGDGHESTGDPISRVARLDGGLISIHEVESIVGDWLLGDWQAIDPANTQQLSQIGDVDSVEVESHAAD
jgi:chemotaxis signal transduction protein